MVCQPLRRQGAQHECNAAADHTLRAAGAPCLVMDAAFAKRAQQAANAAPSQLDVLLESDLSRRSPDTAAASAEVQHETLAQLQGKCYPSVPPPPLAVVQQELAEKKANLQRIPHLALNDGGRKLKLVIARLARYVMLRQQQEEKQEQERKQQRQGWQQGQHQGGSGDSVTVLSGDEQQQQQQQQQQQAPAGPANQSKAWLAKVSCLPPPCPCNHLLL